MNCHDIGLILDDRDTRRLSAAETRAVEAHIETCADCALAFQAHERMLAAAVPPMPAGLADRCRHVVVAAAASAPPAWRAGGRPFVVGAMLLVGAAAAAVVGVQLTGGGEERPVGGPLDLGAEPMVLEALPDAPVSSSDSEPVPPAAGVAGASAVAAEPELAPGQFTVAVTPLQQRATNAEAILWVEAIHRGLLDELGRVPNLVLVEVPLGDGAGLPLPDPSSFDPSTGTDPQRIANVTGPDSLESGRTVTLVDARGLDGSNGTGPVDLNRIPSALIGRIETITGGASVSYGSDAVAGIVNVILDSNVEGMRVDLNYENAEPLAHDYDVQLDFVGSDSEGAWRFDIQGRSRRGHRSSGGVSQAFGNRAATGPAVAEIVAREIEQLRGTLFPLDPSLIAELDSRARNRASSANERYRALMELDQIAKWGDDANLGRILVDGAMALAAETQDPELQVSIWRMLRGTSDERLIQPLSDAMLYHTDERVRLEAATTLEEYADNSVARAMLEVAGLSDTAASVRTYARWAALDDASRRQHVISTLLNEQLTDDERLAVLESEAYTTGSGRDIGLDAAIDGSVTAALTGLIQRIDAVNGRRTLLGRLGALDAPSLAPVVVERLAYDADEIVRSTAAAVLGRYVEEPGVRAALERAAASDSSGGVRQAAARALGMVP